MISEDTWYLLGQYIQRTYIKVFFSDINQIRTKKQNMFQWKGFITGDKKVAPLPSTRTNGLKKNFVSKVNFNVEPTACVSVCASQAISRKLLKSPSSNLARWLRQTWGPMHHVLIILTLTEGQQMEVTQKEIMKIINVCVTYTHTVSVLR